MYNETKHIKAYILVRPIREKGIKRGERKSGRLKGTGEIPVPSTCVWTSWKGTGNPKDLQVHVSKLVIKGTEPIGPPSKYLYLR